MNADFDNIEQFDTLASQWWDPTGPCKPLHHINPARLSFIEKYSALEGKKIVDIGCGGGLLTEAMAARGAICTGIDLSSALIQVATLHAERSSLAITYHVQSIEAFAEIEPASFDIITCMEMLEHVPDPQSVLNAAVQLLKPGGHLFLSTLHRKPKSFLFGIIAAEYLLKILPKGTHTYAQFIRPSELCEGVRQAGLSVLHLSGLDYHPFLGKANLTPTIDINYLLHAQKE